MAKFSKREQGTSAPTGNETAPQSVGDTTVSHDERDRIAMRAYELYLERGGADGAAMDDWLNAERELTGATPGRSEES